MQIFSIITMIILSLVNTYNQTSIISKTDSKSAVELTAKRAKVDEFSGLKGFENGDCFAGCGVNNLKMENDYYFAYITYGSGIPILIAICYKIDINDKVTKIGVLKKNISPNGIINHVDPVTCEGVV